MMRTIGVVLLFGLVALVAAAPLDELDADKWTLVPDATGRLHLVNLNPYNLPDEQQEPEKRFTADTDTIFRLYTHSNPAEPQVIGLNDTASLANSSFNPGHPTRFIIHGWMNDGFSEVNTILTNAWLKRGNFNVITVDWSTGANTIIYPVARNRILSVGSVVSSFINFLASNTGIDFNSISIAGHSLGAHVAGKAGSFQSGRLNTIFGMDPALPLFANDSSDRIQATDAQYVESIHTNAGLLGFELPLGISSFYPNGGRIQPGCGMDITGSCAHGRSYEFLAESIIRGGFSSTPCQTHQQILENKCVVTGANRPMGGEPSNINTGTRGVFTLTTREANPFSLD